MPGTRPGVQFRRAAVLVQPVAHCVGHRAVLVGELQLAGAGASPGRVARCVRSASPRGEHGTAQHGGMPRPMTCCVTDLEACGER